MWICVSFFRQEIRVIGMAVTLIGIIYFSVVMGFIVDVIRATMDNLKKGKNKVAVEDHTVSDVATVFKQGLGNLT